MTEQLVIGLPSYAEKGLLSVVDVWITNAYFVSLFGFALFREAALGAGHGRDAVGFGYCALAATSASLGCFLRWVPPYSGVADWCAFLL